MPLCQLPVSAVFGFRKASKEIFSELDETKGQLPIFHNLHGVRTRDEEGPEGGHTMPWHGSPSGRAKGWCGPLWPTPTSPLRLFKATL